MSVDVENPSTGTPPVGVGKLAQIVHAQKNRPAVAVQERPKATGLWVFAGIYITFGVVSWGAGYALMGVALGAVGLLFPAAPLMSRRWF